MHKLDFMTREAQKKTSNAFVRIDVDFENAFRGKGGGVTFDTGVQQGSGLVPHAV
jgi:hypothetical protein